MTQPLVGLMGRKRSGKDTFAAVLVEELDFVRVAFADPLRQAALALDPLVGRPSLPMNLAPAHDVRLSEVIDAIGWEKAKDLVPEVRRTLQRLGTDSIRALDEGFWVRTAMGAISTLREASQYLPGRPVVVTDVRFPNEAEAISDAGGCLIRIVRPATEEADPHPTETALDGYPADADVFNTGTVADLQGIARAIVGGDV